MIENDFAQLPLVDDFTVKEAFAEFCAGLNFVHGNLHMTFASLPQITARPRHQSGSSRLELPCQ